MSKQNNTLFLIYGADNYRKEKYIKKLKTEILENSDERLNFDKLDGEKTDLSTLKDTLERAPFLGDRRLILVEKPPFFGGKADEKVINYLLDYLEDPIASNVLIFVTEKVDKRSKLFKKMKEKGEILQLDPLKQRDVEELAKEKIESMGLKFEKEAFSLLLQHTEGNIHMIENELEKLSLAVDGKITTEVIEKYVPSSIETNIFKFVDKLGRSEDIDLALKQLRELLLNEPLQRVFYMITRQFRLLYRVKLLEKEKYTGEQIARELKLPSFVVKKLRSQAKKFTLEELSSKVIELVELDYMLKTSGVLEEEYVLEKIVIDSAASKRNLANKKSTRSE